MTLLILISILSLPFALTLSAYALTNGFECNNSNHIDNNTLELIEINNSLQLCFENIA